MTGRMVIHRDDEVFRVNVLDDDGTVLASSKSFRSTDEAASAAERLRRIVSDAEVIDQGEDNAVRASAEVAAEGSAESAPDSRGSTHEP